MRKGNTSKWGLVEYEGRAFHQDAVEAMKGDIVRGLIELITNSDDAYLENRGKIRIEIDRGHGPWKVLVRDRAKGMRSLEMEKKIKKLGAQTSGFEAGACVRGTHGRGAKDLAAFGQVTFESICDDRYSQLILHPDGKYELKKERDATKADRQNLHVPRGNGTVVTVLISQNISCPRFKRLAEKLAKHYQLRDILSDPNRQVVLVDLKKDVSASLRFSYPSLKTVYSESLPIKGYEAFADVVIWRNEERYDDPPGDPCRPAGLLIKGRKAIHENTLFSFERDPYAGWFSGYVKCDFIDRLARDYDRRFLAGETAEKANSIPIIKRSRDGLQHNHPFFQALAAAVEEPLAKLVKEEAIKAKQHGFSENAALRKSLDGLGRDLARLMNEDLREIEAEELFGGVGGEEVPELRLVPEDVIVYMDEPKTVTAQVRADLGIRELSVSADPEGVIEFTDGSLVPLRPHKRRSDILTGQIRINGLEEDKAAILGATVGTHSAEAFVEVRPSREIVVIQVEPPDSLEFERDRYKIAWKKHRTIRLLAPVEVVAEHRKTARVSSSNAAVVVKGGGTAELMLDENLEYYVGHIEIEARDLGAKATLTAVVGSVMAQCKVIVAKQESPDLKIRIVPEEAGKNRALVDQEGDLIVIKILGLHPAMKRYLGPSPAFPGQNLDASKALIAEIVAGEAARKVMEKKFPNSSASEQLDGAGFYAEHLVYLSKYLARCHRILLPEINLKKDFEASSSAT